MLSLVRAVIERELESLVTNQNWEVKVEQCVAKKVNRDLFNGSQEMVCLTKVHKDHNCEDDAAIGSIFPPVIDNLGCCIVPC